MHLISALVAGIAGAGGGVAQLFVRGTSTRATWYTDFEGATAVSSGADILLGTYGEKNVYVAEFVRVVVKSSTGVTLRDWVEGVADGCVEVRSDSFTGVDYATSKSAVGNPTNLGAVLDLWDDSAGGDDWEVGSGGTAIEDAVGAVTGVFYNVKTYGAVGDGVTNDRAAIAAANTAAATAGGGTLFFPPGTYLVGSTLSISSTVSLLGAGRGITHVSVSSAAAVLTIRNTVQGISFENTVNIAGPMVTMAGGAAIDCQFGRNGSLQPTATALVSVTSTPVLFSGCVFRGQGTTPTALKPAGDYIAMRVVGCQFDFSFTSLDTPMIDGDGRAGLVMEIVGCAFGSPTGYMAGSSSIFACDFTDTDPQSWVVSGCFVPVGNGTAVFSVAGDPDASLQESGNAPALSFSLGTGVPYRLASGSWQGQYGLGMRANLSINYSTNAAVTIDSLSYGQVTITRTNNSAQTVTFTDAPPGSRLTVVYYNNQVATSGTITFDTSRVKMEAASNQFTVAADSFRVFEFRSVLIGSTLYWAQVAEDTVDEAE